MPISLIYYFGISIYQLGTMDKIKRPLLITKIGDIIPYEYKDIQKMLDGFKKDRNG